MSDAERFRGDFWNGDFSFYEADGITCEWDFIGEGVPVHKDGLQGLTKIPQGSFCYIRQVVPFCSPGAVYKVIAHINGKPEPGVSAWLGIDPTGGKDTDQVIWTVESATDVLQLTVTAQSTNCAVYVGVSSENADGNIYFDRVDFEILAPSSRQPDDVPGLRVSDPVARAALDSAFNLIRNKVDIDEAERRMRPISEGVSGTRADAAAAIVGMQEVRKWDEHELYDVPRHQWQDHQGIGNLRKVIEEYPEQTEPCALAECKLGEYYLYNGITPLGTQILEHVAAGFPGTEGAGWAQMALVNAYMWQGDNARAGQLVDEMTKAYEEGRLSARQMGWADYNYHGQILAHSIEPGARERFIDFQNEIWNKYKDSFPELAVRAKLYRARMYAGRQENFRAMEDYREMIEAIPPDKPFMAPARSNLALILISLGWLPEHYKEGRALLQEVLESPMAETDEKKFAKGITEAYGDPATHSYSTWELPLRGVDILANGDFEQPLSTNDGVNDKEYQSWVIRPLPNWPSCDWYDGAPEPGLGKRTPAWSSVNGRCDEVTLLHERRSVTQLTPYCLEAWVAADAWEGGLVGDVSAELSIRFTDGFDNVTAEETTQLTSIKALPKEWEHREIKGVTPENTRYMTMSVKFRVKGEGQHNFAVSKASFILKEDGQGVTLGSLIHGCSGILDCFQCSRLLL